MCSSHGSSTFRIFTLHEQTMAYFRPSKFLNPFSMRRRTSGVISLFYSHLTNCGISCFLRDYSCGMLVRVLRRSPRDDANSSHRRLTVFVCWNVLSSSSFYVLKYSLTLQGSSGAIFCTYIKGRVYEVYIMGPAVRGDVRKNRDFNFWGILLNSNRSEISRLRILKLAFHGRRFRAAELIQRTDILSLRLEIR
jgi:hypothetical protein